MEPQQRIFLIEIAIESALYILIFFSVIAFLVGAVLLIAPQKIAPLRHLTDRWITPRKLFKPLEIPRESERFLYRNHQWVGAIAIFLPVITLYLLLYSGIGQLSHSAVSNLDEYLFWQWLFESAILFLWASNIFAFVAGIIIFFRPSLLKKIEGITNHWLSTRQSLRWFNRSYSKFDDLMLARSRWTGIFLILGSLYTLVFIITFMLQHPDWLDLLMIYLYKA